MKLALVLIPMSTVGCLTPANTVDAADFQAAIDRIDALEEDVRTLRGELAGLYAADEALDERVVTVEDLSASRLGYLDADLTLTIPGDQPDLVAALSWLQGYAISSDARVTLQLADGTHAFTQALAVDHRDGQHIEIVGNIDNPSRVVLEFTSTWEGLRLEQARALGGLAGVTVRAVNPQPLGVGMWIADGASLRCTGPVVVEGWTAEGVGVHRNASVWCDDAVVQDNGGEGFLVTAGSALRALDARSQRNGSHGYSARLGASMDVRGATSSINGQLSWQAGFRAELASAVDADDALAGRSGGAGFLASGSSAMVARGTTSGNNGGAGYAAEDGSFVWAGDGAVASDNQVGMSSLRSSSLVTWGGAQALDNASDGLAVGLSSSLEADTVDIFNNGQYGVNAYWGGVGLVRDATFLGNLLDTNVPTSTEARNLSGLFSME